MRSHRNLNQEFKFEGLGCHAMNIHVNVQFVFKIEMYFIVFYLIYRKKQLILF